MTDSKRRTSTEEKTGKPPGTILDERYSLNGVIGTGGFSIVYDAVNLHSGQRVAIKECTVSDVREKFLKEARMLKDFSDEPAIVSVLDYFEDESTAYIVMEYLEGVTLREHIINNGSMTTEQAVRLLSPVMDSLIKIHESGIVHRDISPDNIMLLDDGTLKLLDFGAAREYVDNKVSKLIYKANYSPPELMDEDGNVGRWSDVYSMSATIYFCISGHDPEDVVSRLLLDELKSPSSLGADILPPAEKLLLQGLEAKPGNRLQDMYKLKTGLETLYPFISEEEKAARAKAKKKKRLLAVAGIAILLLGAAVFANAHKLQILFNMIDTETIILDGSDFTENEFRNSSKIVKERVKAFSNGQYLWDVNGREIRFEVPSELFGGDDPTTFTRVAISRPIVMYFCTYDANTGQYPPVEIVNQSKDIENVDIEGDTKRIVFTNTGSKKFEKYLTIKDQPIGFGLDLDMDNYGSYKALTSGDGKTVVIDDSDADYGISDDLLRLHFTNDPSDKAFSVDRKWTINWETPESSLIPGSNQVSFDRLKDDNKDGRLVCLCYKKRYSSLTEEAQGHDASFLSMQAIIRNRLDAFSIPYSMGKDPYDPDAIIVGLPGDKICLELITALGMGSGDLTLGGKMTNTSITYSLDYEIKDTCVDLNFKSYATDEDKDKMVAFLKNLKKQGQSSLYLYFLGIPVTGTNIDEALNSININNTVSLADWCIQEPHKDLTKGFANFMRVFFEQAADNDYEMYASQLLDSKGELISDDSSTVIPFLFKSEAKAQEYIRKWQKDAGDGMTIKREDRQTDYIYDSRTLGVGYFYDEAPAPDDIRAIESFCDLYKKHIHEFSDGTFNSVVLHVFYGRDNYVQKTDGTYGPNTTAATIKIGNDEKSGKPFVSYVYTENAPELKKAIVDYLKKDPVFSKMITEKSEIQ